MKLLILICVASKISKKNQIIVTFKNTYSKNFYEKETQMLFFHADWLNKMNIKYKKNIKKIKISKSKKNTIECNLNNN